MKLLKRKDNTLSPEYIDNDMIFGEFEDNIIGLNLNNKLSNRSANVLVIGGTGSGKTFKYIKPNILQENCSMVITDPSGDIFRSFGAYLVSRGYNVYLLNASDFTLSNNYNPLENVYDSDGEISETRVDILVDLYMKNAKNSQAEGGKSQDPFWDGAEKSFLTALIYYTLEEDMSKLKAGFTTEEGKQECQGFEGGRCFSTVLALSQEAKVSEDSDEESPLTLRMNDFFRRHPDNKTSKYYATFLTCKSEKTVSTIVLCTALDLQLFSTRDVDLVTRTSEYEDQNINIKKIATEQSYLFLGIPQSHQAYNFLIAMLYSQLYGTLYDLGERGLRGKYHLGYRIGTPVFKPFDTEEEAIDFYENVSKDDIVPVKYINDQTIYHLNYNGSTYKTSFVKEPLEKIVDELDKMYIWSADKYSGGDPALPIHVNFLLDEFKNIGEIPNFLTILATSRKYRIGSHVVIQGIDQLKTMYKDNEWGIIPSNCDTLIFLGVPEEDTEDREYVQKILGKTTIIQKSTSSSNSGPSTSLTPTEVDLMSMDDISALNKDNRDDEIVIVRSVNAFVCQKLNLTKHRRWNLVKSAPKIDIELYFRTNTKRNLYKN